MSRVLGARGSPVLARVFRYRAGAVKIFPPGKGKTCYASSVAYSILMGSKCDLKILTLSYEEKFFDHLFINNLVIYFPYLLNVKQHNVTVMGPTEKRKADWFGSIPLCQWVT